VRSIATVLVCVLVFLVGAGLGIIAVVKVQDAAARIKCANNLRLLALSIHNYHDSREVFPQAEMANPDLPPESRFSWIVVILPFVQSDDFYSRMDKEKGWDAEENHFAAVSFEYQYLVQCHGCADRRPASTLVSTNYVGIAGLGLDAASLPAGDPRAGFFGRDRKLTGEEIQGRMATLLVALETAQASGAWTAAGFPTVRGLEGDLPYLGSGRPWGGTHRSGTLALFADASARFLPESIDPRVLEAAAVLKGGEEAKRILDN
jgi:hypothetical protein